MLSMEHISWPHRGEIAEDLKEISLSEFSRISGCCLGHRTDTQSSSCLTFFHRSNTASLENHLVKAGL